MYGYKFVICEFLNLINILGQMWFLNSFLLGQFLTYGPEIISLASQPMETRTDPMSKVFPKMVKCTFVQYGPAGTVESKDGLCILPINSLNEKIFIFIWFWYLFLLLCSSLASLYSVTTIVSVSLRGCVLSTYCGVKNQSDIEFLTKMWYGDWFIIVQLSKGRHH